MDVAKLFLIILFLPFIVLYYIGKLIFFLVRRERENRALETVANFEARLAAPPNPTVINVPISSRNTLYGSQQSND
jgi:hypothetical protein